MNIESKAFSRELLDTIEPWLFEWVVARGGSLSAEHGLGFKKRAYLGLGKSSVAVQIMRNLKSQFDPTGILNPYKVV